MWLEETPDSHKWQHKYFKVCCALLGLRNRQTDTLIGFGYEQG